MIKIFDYGCTVEGVPFIAMELLPGRDLSALIQHSLAEHQRALPPQFVCRIVEQAAWGLEAAHEAGLVHRDIKPDNIFVSDVGGEPFVRLLDFGIVKDTADTSPSLTGTQASIGTPHTMSPEQIYLPKEVDFRTDLWSLAVVAYHALTAAWPFNGEISACLFIRIHQGVFAPPSSLRPELPQALDAWFLRALAQDPSRRFASARELSQTLAAAFAAQPAAMAAHPSAAEHTPAPPRRVAPSDTMSPAISTPRRPPEGLKRIVGVVVGAASLALGLGALSWWLGAEPTEPAPAASAPMPSSVPQPPTSSVRQPSRPASALPSTGLSSASKAQAAALGAASSAVPPAASSAVPSAASSPAPATPARVRSPVSPAAHSPASPSTGRASTPRPAPTPATNSCAKYGIDCPGKSPQ